MSDQQPRWRQGFDAVESTIGPRLTEMVNSEAFAVAVGLVRRTQRAVQKQTERNTRRLLHLYNLPAGSDVTRILAEIGDLQRQLRELTRQVEATREAPSNGTTPGNERPARPRPTRH